MSERDEPRAPASAAEWYVALDSAAPDEATSARFGAWLAQSDEHEAQLARCSAAAGLAARLRDDPELRWAYDEAASLAAGEPARARSHPLAVGVRNAARFFSPLRLGFAAALLAAMAIAITIAVTSLVVDGGDDSPPSTAARAARSAANARATQIMAGVPAANPAVTLPGRVVVDSGSVAVLPFAAPPGNDEAGVSYRDFASGFYRDVVAALRTLPAIYVVAAPAVYAAGDLAPSEIGAQLGTRGVLTGSVEATDGGFEIAVTLLDAATNAVVWEMRYDAPLAEAGGVQSDVIDHIASALVDPELRARSAAADARADNRVTGFRPDIAPFE